MVPLERNLYGHPFAGLLWERQFEEVLLGLARGIENQLARTRLDHLSDTLYIEKVFKNLRQKLNRSENDQMVDLKTNVLTWGLFLSTTMKASVHLGPDYHENLVWHPFRGAQDVVRHHAEIDLGTQIRDSECFHD